MFDQIANLFTNPTTLLAILAAVAVAATVITLAMPLLAPDRLQKRMRSVAIERDRIRLRERARLASDQQKRASLRNEPARNLRRIVESFNLRKALADDNTVARLRMAGFRGQAPLFVFLLVRAVLPLVLFVVAVVYLFFVGDYDQPTYFKFFMAILVAYAGFYAPVLYVRNTIQKRQQSIKKAWPDALDLLLICVESGMSAEAAFRKVSEEIGAQSMELAEELMLTTAELSYLPDRRQAYENLSARTGLDGVKAVMLALTQAEKYGTPLGQSLRVMAQENRDIRMNEAEKKAAALPPKLTVPMILFFLPVLFGVILGPSVIQLMRQGIIGGG
ncbi:MAG: type II secretion system F family protein [Bauldia sp.]|nr:type II secretion system F family protein [Bauldia sp.]MCW5717606.1 type II secretion system F family protein [Bauldia sp.]